uniref:Cytoplasmic dynein light chain n=1 Tax=Solanum tuberosum TaxID=4113 RepID=M0ZRI7_SOLTU
MLEGKGVIEDTDMPVKMQIQAMRWASQALDVYDVLHYRSIAAHIKKVNLRVFELNCVTNLKV